MSPFERVRARAAALEVLGVSHYADQEEIRAAWRKLAFESHPDRNEGNHIDFERVRAAYDFLQEGPKPQTAPEPKKPDAPPPSRMSVPRPTLTKRVDDLDDHVRGACRDLLKSDARVTSGMTAANDDPSVSAPGSDDNAVKSKSAKDHVPDAVSRLGRRLTFQVSRPLSKGINRVALPTTVLANDRVPNPRILSFFSHDDGAGVVHVPDSVAREMFPGARSVRIRFVGGQIERPITALKAS